MTARSPDTPRTFAEVAPLLRLALPIVAGLAASMVIGVVDTVMIAPLGTVPLAAASLTGSVLIVLYSGLYGFLSAAGVEVSYRHGAGDASGAGRALGAAVRLAWIAGAVGGTLMAAAFLALEPLGQPPEAIEAGRAYWLAMAATLVPFTVLVGHAQFLNAIDRPWAAAGLQFATVVLNVPLNYALIWGVGPIPALGLFGAGVGSLLAGLLGVGIGSVWLRRARSLAPYRTGRAAVSDGELACRLARDGLPLAVGYTGEGAAYAVVGLLLGLFGATALAANQIVQSVGGLLYMLPLGMSAAVSIRVGQAVGAGRPERLRPVAKAAILSVATWMLVTAAGLLLGGEAIARALSTDPEVVALATAMFVAIAAIQLADGVQGTALGALRGAMDFRWPTAFTLGCYWLFALPLAWVLGVALGGGPIGVLVGYGAGIALAAAVLPWRFWRLTGGVDPSDGRASPDGPRGSAGSAASRSTPSRVRRA